MSFVFLYLMVMVCQVIQLTVTEAFRSSDIPGSLHPPSPRSLNVVMEQILSEFITYSIVPFEIFMYLLTESRMFIFLSTLLCVHHIQ